MPATMPLPHLRPISDLRTDLNGICKEARESHSPIFLTKNGTATLVVMDCDAYERQRQHERYVLNFAKRKSKHVTIPKASRKPLSMSTLPTSLPR